MKIVSYMVDYSFGEVDLLRWVMGKKNFVIMRENREKFIERVIKNGYIVEKLEEIFELIDKFVGYGFNKFYFVVYVMILYWIVYFKVYYLVYYYVVVMIFEILEIGDIVYYFNDVKEYGIRIYFLNINFFSVYFEVKNDGIIYFFVVIKNFGLIMVKKIVEDVKLNGKYIIFEEFVFRNKKNGMNKRVLEVLILLGVLDEIKGNRKEKFLLIDKVLDYSLKVLKIDEI